MGFFKYLACHHKREYLDVAIEFKTTPWHVYDIAHGKSIHTSKDKIIAHDLLSRGIIHRHRHSQNPEDYDMTKRKK